MKRYLYIVPVFLVGIFFGIYIQPLISADNVYSDIKKFDQVMLTAYKNYVEDINSGELVDGAIKGMLEQLDPHSVYFSAEQMVKVNEDIQGGFDGIGVEFDVVNDTIVIVTPIVGGPSEALGILANDKIVKINDTTAIGLSREDIPKKLKGLRGTVVTVHIKREGSPDLLRFDITRDRIPVYSIDAKYMIEGTDIGVVEINRFAQTTHKEFIQAMDSLKKLGMKKVIIDLRWNPGGILDEAYYIADEFVRAGDTIVYTKGRIPDIFDTYISTKGQNYENMPVIVMINEGSASASEILSGAIQDLDRGLVVGETSFGKGLVQRQFPLPDMSAFRLTVGYYYTPSGRCIQRPYKDKDKYRNLAGRLDLEEGSYLDNAFSKITAQVEKMNAGKKPEEQVNIKNLPLHKTKNGRTVFGGGGITPDYIIKMDTVTKFTMDLFRKNIPYTFAKKYIDDNGKSLREKYYKNFSDYYRNFAIDNNIIKELRKYSEEKSATWNDDQFKTDSEYLKNTIKGYIARYIWNREKMVQILNSADKQLLKAIELFPLAEKLSAR
jgi:carboxyl-terminal processing protease